MSDTAVSVRRRVTPLKLAIIQDGRLSYVIAVEAGMNPCVLSGITSGTRTPTPVQRACIARALNRTESELFDS